MPLTATRTGGSDACLMSSAARKRPRRGVPGAAGSTRRPHVFVAATKSSTPRIVGDLQGGESRDAPAAIHSQTRPSDVPSGFGRQEHGRATNISGISLRP